MTTALSMFSGMLWFSIRMDIQIAQAEKDDLRSLIESDFDKRIVARH
jgi:hypothetical protein